MYTINGKFLSRSINGQIRVATEIIKELDKIVPPRYIEIVAPPSKFDVEGLMNIEILRIGKGNPHVWEQTYYAKYLKSTGNIGVNFLNTHPFFQPDISYVHDVIFKAYPNLFSSLYGRLQKKYISLMIKSAVKRARSIITVSEFSKKEIEEYYSKCQKEITVIYNGWQHMKSISEDQGIFLRHQTIKKNDYVLSVSSITPQKNFSWIIRNATYNKEQQYIIVGSKENSTQDDIRSLDNVLYTGHISDGEMKALMHYCKAFIHPAVYEGFAITPLEAIASGCRNIIVSKVSCMPEIYGEYVHYIDPSDPRVIISDILREECLEPRNLLNKYSWEKSASQLYEILKELTG